MPAFGEVPHTNRMQLCLFVGWGCANAVILLAAIDEPMTHLWRGDARAWLCVVLNLLGVLMIHYSHTTRRAELRAARVEREVGPLADALAKVRWPATPSPAPETVVRQVQETGLRAWLRLAVPPET